MGLSKHTEEEERGDVEFTTRQLQHLQKEIKEAGGFDELMLNKLALRKVGGSYGVLKLNWEDVSNYWERFFEGTEYYQVDHEFLVNKYQVPYVYWTNMRRAMKERLAAREYAEKKKLEHYEEVAKTVDA